MFFLGLCRSLFRKIGKNILVRGSKPQFNCPEVHDSWKNIAFGNLCIFFSNWDLEQILYESFVATFRQLRQNSNPSVHRNILNKKCSLFDQNYIFLVYGSHWCNFEPPKKTILSICQFGIQRIQRNDWMKFLSHKELELFYHFRALNGKSPQLLPENFVTVVKYVLKWPGCVFRLTYYFPNCANFFVLFVFWLIQLHFWLIFLRQGLQNCTLRARRSFRGKTFGVRFFFIFSNFSEFERKIFRLMATTVRQHSSDISRGKNFTENISLKKWCLFWFYAEVFSG